MDWENKFQALVLECQSVGDDFGIYPAAIKRFGDERAYEQRTGFQNGWNAAIMEYGKAFGAAVSRAKQGMNQNLQMLLNADVGSLTGEGDLEINMNDVWGWASADSERVPKDQIEEVARLFFKYGWCGILYWSSERNTGGKSEFHDVNRFIEFVRREEELRKAVTSDSARAYKKLRYELGAD